MRSRNQKNSDSEGSGQKVQSQSQANSWQDHVLKKTHHKKKKDGVTQALRVPA
jgi:hypothetical protein